MSADPKDTLREFERALDKLAEALRECERLLASTELPPELVRDDTFQRLLRLLHIEGPGEPAPDGGEGSGTPRVLH